MMTLIPTFRIPLPTDPASIILTDSRENEEKKEVPGLFTFPDVDSGKGNETRGSSASGWPTLAVALRSS
jgi:hypothetical protein